MEQGMVHLYWGNGKGKTTAAVGLAVRALGSGARVCLAQFLKDGESGELWKLRTLGAAVYSGASGGAFLWQMSAGERLALKARQTALLEKVLKVPCELLILDEACGAWAEDTVDRELLKRAVLERPAGQEVVLTGREPAGWMLEAADYSTKMCACRHPYDRGIPARAGIEY